MESCEENTKPKIEKRASYHDIEINLSNNYPRSISNCYEEQNKKQDFEKISNASLDTLKNVSTPADSKENIKNISQTSNNSLAKQILNETTMCNFKTNKRQLNKISFSRQKRQYRHQKNIKKLCYSNKFKSRYMNKKLEFYYNNHRKNIYNREQLKKKSFSCSILKTISRVRLLKNFLAKENILGRSGSTISNSDKSNNLSNDIKSSSHNGAVHSTNIIKTVVNIADDNSLNRSLDTLSSNMNSKKEVVIPYNTGAISVAVAHVDNCSVLDYKKTSPLRIQENKLLQGSLTSAESYMSQVESFTLTSSPEISNVNSKKDVVINNKTLEGNSSASLSSYSNRTWDENSSATLTPHTVHRVISDNETFVIAKTSSYFDKPNIESEDTLVPDDRNEFSKPANDFQNRDNEYQKPCLLNTIINIGMYPEMIDSTDNNDNLNTVIITDEKFKKTRIDNNLVNDFTTHDIDATHTMKKIFNSESTGENHICFSLPNENTIKEMLIDKEKAQKISCSEESRYYKASEDFWDKLTMVLDTTIKNLEKSVIQTISNELKQVVSIIEKSNNSLLEDNKIKREISNIEAAKTHLDEELQCCLVQNNVIDVLTQKIKYETKTDSDFKDFLKSVEGRKKLSLEIIKQPAEPCTSKEKTIEDSIDVSLSEAIKVHKELQLPIPIKIRFFINTLNFVKENILVIVSVPIFCCALIFIYSFLVLVKTMW